LAPQLEGKRIGIILRGTRPERSSLGFRSGELEGRTGRFYRVGERDTVKIWLGVDMITVPCQFVKPQHPTVKSEKVVAIQGDQLGSDFVVVRFGAEQCGLSFLESTTGGRSTSRISLAKRKVDTTLSTYYLAII
jgi:hypothetical protein